MVLCLLSFALKAQEVIIGTGTSNNYTTAFYPYYEDSWWESVYSASEIGMSGNITSVALQHDGGGTLACQNVRIYMGYAMPAVRQPNVRRWGVACDSA